MFTGIIETIGRVTQLKEEGTNLHVEVESDFTQELKIDQSVSHNGICLTVVDISDKKYTVTAIEETLQKTNLKDIAVGNPINLERGMKLGDRLDGHIVQGHVDQIGVCTSIKTEDGSWIFSFEYNPETGNVTIEKGSITVNGVSLTVVNSRKDGFDVAIIPYTYENTIFHTIKEGDAVNLEFDVVGKYVSRLTSGY